MPKQTQSIHPWLRKDSWTLWEWWILATVAGGLVGIGIAGIASVIASNLGPASTIALIHFVGALEGMVLGFTQWLVLRRYIKHIRWWIVATGISGIVAWLIGLKVIVMLTLIFFDKTVLHTLPFDLLKAVFFLGAWVGAVFGLAQWFVLKTHVRKGIVWILANALAWGLGLLIVVIGATLTKPGEFSMATVLIGIVTGVTAGVVVGAITGIPLVWLLKPRLLKHH
ncbi:MAG: hypothetical protein WCA35_11655 [Kovacikia sp.]